jgi:hypothetical protein
MPTFIRRLIVSVAAVCAVACREPSERGDTTTAVVARPPVTPAVPGHYTLDDFRRLRWIEGRWQGFMPDGGKFYERYTFVNDSTIAMHAFKDSTLKMSSDSARIVLRNTMVTNEGAASSWVATRLDSTGIDFAPQRRARNYFTWAREDGSKWNATLRWTDEQGRPQTVVYALRRFGR